MTKKRITTEKWWRDYDAECAVALAADPWLQRLMSDQSDSIVIPRDSLKIRVEHDPWEDFCREVYGRSFSGHLGVIELP